MTNKTLAFSPTQIVLSKSKLKTIFLVMLLQNYLLVKIVTLPTNLGRQVGCIHATQTVNSEFKIFAPLIIANIYLRSSCQNYIYLIVLTSVNLV